MARERWRRSGRVVLIDSRDRVLLLCWADPRLGIERVWITPGGGVKPGESWEDAARRELLEETALRVERLGPLLWERRVRVPFDGDVLHSHERFFLMRVERHDVDHSGMEAGETDVFAGHRWWSLDELEAARDLVFAPRRLPELLVPVLAGDLPRRAVALGW